MTWQRVRAEFESLVEQSATARRLRLLALDSTDHWLADQLRSLLQHDADAPHFLERAPNAADATAVPAAAAGRRFGRFTLVRPLGSGGMGAVWEAVQSDPERRVAIKLVARPAGSDVERWRFEHEVQVLAGLNHPAIATFHDAGSDVLDGTEVAWLAMELVEGARDVLVWTRDRQLSLPDRLELFLRLCDAVEYGHRRGVLHRDLKPSNVLVGREGQLKLIDFGIARALEGAEAGAAHTLTGEVVGTVQYMAPEQLQGRKDAIGTPCDVYALGVILYHLLCERAPFDFEGVPLAQMASLVLEQEPKPPARVKPGLPQDLGWILLRALEKDPARRYPTATALADDIGRFRSHLPVLASPPSAIYRLRKFVRRHRVVVAIAAAIAIGLGAGTYGLWSGMQRARAGELRALRGTDLSREVARVTVGLFDGIDDTEASRDMKVYELLDAAVIDSKTTADPNVELAIREVRGSVFARLHRFAEARRELQRVRELRGLVPTTDFTPAELSYWEDRSLVSDALLGRALVRVGEQERGWQLVRDAEAATRARSSDGVRLAVLGTLCALLVDENANEELARRAIELGEVAQRAGDERTRLVADMRLARAAGSLGRHAEAKVAAERAWRGSRELFGPRDKLTCEALAAHVTALQEAGDLDAAAALYPELIELTGTLYGRGHTNMLNTLSNQVEVLLKQGRGKEALASMREVVRLHDERGGDMTEDHLAAINNLGMTLSKSGRLGEAEPVLHRAAELSRTVLKAADPTAAMMRINHAACLAGMKRWSEAEPVLLAEYEQLQKLLPASHPWLAATRRTIAEGYGRNGFADEAATWRVK